MEDTTPGVEVVTNKDKEEAANAYILMIVLLLVGIMIPFVNILVGVIFCSLKQSKSKFVLFHTWQAFLPQILLSVLNLFIFFAVIRLIIWAGYGIFDGGRYGDLDGWRGYGNMWGWGHGWWRWRGFGRNGFSLPFFAFMPFMFYGFIIFLANLGYIILSVIAHARARRGEKYISLFFGRWAYNKVYGPR